MIGAPRVHHRRTDSTNERARRLASAGAPHGTLVTAAEQTAGRGRHGRTWSAPPGRSVLASIVVRELGAQAALLPFAAGLAVCDACEACAPVECAIKWPNDVWIDRRKVAGILVEGRPSEGWAVVGVGLNVATRLEELPEEIAESATSLLMASGRDIAPERVLAALLDSLDSRLADSENSLLEAWRARDALRGHPVRWSGGEGTAAGVADSGGLLVETVGGRVALDAGEVHLLSGSA